jgi:hypothetical protein
MMGKKKHKGEKHDRKQDRDHAAHGAERDSRAGGFPLPLAGIAAMVTQQLQSPAARAAMATGLRVAADALSKSATPPQPPVPPQPAAAPHNETPPSSAKVDQAASQGTTRAPDPHDIGVVLGKAAEQLLGAFLHKKP